MYDVAGNMCEAVPSPKPGSLHTTVSSQGRATPSLIVCS